METVKLLLSRWKTEYDFKTFLTASGSLAVTAVFAFYNGFLGLSHRSLWYGTICVYYIVLVLLRGLIITAERRISSHKMQETVRNKVCLAASFLLLSLNICLIVPVSIMVRQQKPVNMTLIPAIAMAAYTTYKITMASVNLRKRKASANSLVWLLRTISFIDALVSILTLQNTLIMVNSDGSDPSMMPLTAISSACIWVTVLLLSFHAIVRAVRRSKSA